jgi:hypothetical protein
MKERPPAHFKPRFITILAALILLPAGALALTQTNGSPFDHSNRFYLQYRQLIERVKSGDFTIDFVSLISADSDWDISEKYRIKAPNREAMESAFAKKDYEKASALAEIVLEYEFTNIGLHNACANAYRELGKNDRADYHNQIAAKLLDALLSTGDGKSIETAYCVKGISEEYMIMRHFGYKVTMQASIEGDYDALSGENSQTGKSVTLFFDISGLFSRCVQRHGDKGKDEFLLPPNRPSVDPLLH